MTRFYHLETKLLKYEAGHIEFNLRAAIWLRRYPFRNFYY